jgi:hypothetical protein
MSNKSNAKNIILNNITNYLLVNNLDHDLVNPEDLINEEQNLKNKEEFIDIKGKGVSIIGLEASSTSSIDTGSTGASTTISIS